MHHALECVDAGILERMRDVLRIAASGIIECRIRVRT